MIYLVAFLSIGSLIMAFTVVYQVEKQIKEMDNE